MRYQNPTPLAAAIALALAGPALAADDTTETITVIGRQIQALDSSVDNGVLGSASILDTPFSVVSISEEELQAHQVSNLETLFSRDASVSVLGGAYSNWGSTMSIRGLALDYTNSFKINGLPFSNFTGEMPYEALERVDVLKGATGFMYGFAAPGGIVNYVTKKARKDSLSLAAGYRTDNIFNTQLDVSSRFGEADRFGLRANLGYEDGDTFTDGGHIRRNSAALAFDGKLTPELTWTVDLLYQDRDVDNVTSWFFTSLLDSDADLPATVDGSRNLSAKGSFEDSQTLVGMTSLAWQLADDWQLKADYSHTENNTRWVKTLNYLVNSDGDLRVRVYDQAFDTDFDTGQLMLSGQFATGWLEHNLVTGVSYQKTTGYRTDKPQKYVFWLTDPSDPSTFDNLYNPNPQRYDSQFVENNEKGYFVRQRSSFLSDTLSFGQHWQLLLGLRHIQYESVSYLAASNYSTSANTPTAALMFKPWQDTTFYGSYVEALEEGGIVGDSYANADQMLDPLKSKQYELGVKFERERWFASAALFRIEKGAAYGNSDNVYVQDGQSRFEGIELDGHLRLDDNWSLRANLMKLDSRYDNRAPGSSIQGNDVEATPDWQGALGLSYRVHAIPGLSLDAGAKYYGKRYLNAANNWRLPDYTLVDASASYQTRLWQRPLTLRATLTNLTDKRYWSTDGTGGLRIGEPRQLAVNASLAF
ncbi:TonB-dependent siderophore receptor [Gallaecimonas xiamenensis]|uniref:TonB-dependent siderophore receptor n=1 Tax=Gallaecimonas xiamenensis 3-C-1 TaxID=745411 RepID=K2J248_9GAMM|nr:TonB-dependent receptor [Gallaecimonas xiamenensis]EKE68917.1 TonB-dependent siderophore receptor [Gallaecimonas xiamenensis 3-C-1]